MAPPSLPRELVHLPLGRIALDETFRLRGEGDVSSLAQSIAQVGQLFPVEVRLVGGSYQPITGFRRLAALRMLMRERVLARVHPSMGDQAAATLAAADAIDSRALEVSELVAMLERYRAEGWANPAMEELISRAIEKEEERLEDLEAVLRGETPPDRSIEDEDALEDDDDWVQPQAVPTAAEAHEAPQEVPHEVAQVSAPFVQAVSAKPTLPPSEPPAPLPLGGGEALTVEDLAVDVVKRLSAATLDLGTLMESWQAVPPHLLDVVREQLAYYLALDAWLERNASSRRAEPSQPTVPMEKRR